MSSLMWIPVPGGRVRDRPVLSVVMTPRLTEQLTTAGMGDWPAVLNDPAVRLTVRTRPVGSTSPDAIQPTATLVRQARSDVWEQFFGTIGVRAFELPRGYHAPAVAPTSTEAADVRGTYLRAAVAVADPQLVEAELQQWRGERDEPTQEIRDRPLQRDASPDFHRAVAMLREHPHVLRLLGLIVDVHLDELPTSTGREISVTWEDSPVPVEARWTRYEFDGELFLPAAAGDITRGVVDLSDRTRWRVIGFDVDGAVGKLHGAARTLASDRSRLADGAPDPGARPSLPPLRSAGLMLTRVGRQSRLAERAAQSLAAASGQRDDTVLTAEDLVLGYRLDVRPEDGDRWFSLHRRRATYQIGTLPEILVEDEEGHVKPHAAVLDDRGLHTDEVVARWDGWSLSVPRPRLDGGASLNRRSERPRPYDFEVAYRAVPASLLELEFGRGYQLRVRVADLAGGGLGLRDRAASGAAGSSAAQETYVRYEPVPPPQLVPPEGLMVPDAEAPGGFRIDPAVVGPGGSLERLVIRSEPGDAGFSTAPFEADPAYPTNRTRRIEAPSTTYSIAEQHGVLRLTDETGVELASRAFVNGQVGEVSVGGSSALPDPAALGVGAAILAQPGLLENERHEERPWEGQWPARIAKVVEVVAGSTDTPPHVRWVTVDDPDSPDGEASPTVELVLPPGCQVDVELTSTVRADWIDHFALNLFLLEGMPGAATGAAAPNPGPNPGPNPAPNAQTAMAAGRHPLLSPPRRLLATHAVRRPLRAAHGTVRIERLPADTVTRVSPPDDPAEDPLWGLHVASTGAIDVGASWQEWGDSAEPVPSEAHVCSISLARGTVRVPTFSHDFGDTKHRVVTFEVTSVSRFRDCFVDPDPSLFRLGGSLDAVEVPSTARPRPPVVVSVVPAFTWRDERVAGTVTRHRLGGRLRVELARPWFTTGEGEAIAVIVWPGVEETLPVDLREQVTWCNRDPIHATSKLPALAGESQFTGFQGAVDVPVTLDGPTVRALVYPVFFHEGHWYADIELPGIASASYSPFVRLAVARFQAQSLVGEDHDLRMSTVVTCDLAPALPDRTLVVTRSGGQIDVTLSGLARLSDRQANRVFASLERLTGPPGVADLTALGLDAPAFPAWTRVAGSTVSGTVGVPLPSVALPADGASLRLVVREVEEMSSNVTALGVDAPDELSDRTVFVDVVELTGM